MRTSFFEALTVRVAATCSRDGTFSDNGLVIPISIDGKFRQFRKECKYIKLIFICSAGKYLETKFNANEVF